MQVLFLIDNLRPGGAQKALLAMAQAVQSTAAEPVVWRLGGTSPLEADFEAAGVRVLGRQTTLFNLAATSFALLRHIRR